MLDLGMPHLDGVEVIRALRGWTTVPILVVSAPPARRTRSRPWMPGPTTTSPNRSRSTSGWRALGRRSAPPTDVPVVRFAQVEIDLAAKQVTRDGVRVHLTPTESRMLEFLARNPGALITRQTLLRDIWGTDQVADTGSLRLYVSQLRKKLEADPSAPRHLLTEQGMGYRLVLD